VNHKETELKCISNLYKPYMGTFGETRGFQVNVQKRNDFHISDHIFLNFIFLDMGKSSVKLIVNALNIFVVFH